jgi:ribosomal protein S18 acetylase RimI-like enzyme
VGFCVMIDTRSISKSMIRREGTDHQVKGGDWFMAAVYVDRSVRGAGTGKKMIQFGIDTIREMAQRTQTDSGVCVTNVVHGNTNALQLYKRMGFQVTNEDDVEEKEGRSYHTTQLQLQL